MKIDWSKIIAQKHLPAARAKRGTVGSLTPRSAQRLTFALANSPRTWAVMATLTFRERVMDGRKTLAKFFRNLRHPNFIGAHVAWVREYQGRGAVHYHVMWCDQILRPSEGITCYNMVSLKSGTKTRMVMRGVIEEAIVEAWCKAVGDTSTEFRAFQEGGIVQLWEGSQGAARYFGSYLAKAKQKALPDDAEKSGRWWWVCPEAKPVPLGTAHLSAWHLEYPLSTVFDKEPLMDYVTKNLPVFIPKWGNKPKQQA